MLVRLGESREKRQRDGIDSESVYGQLHHGGADLQSEICAATSPFRRTSWFGQLKSTPGHLVSCEYNGKMKIQLTRSQRIRHYASIMRQRAADSGNLGFWHQFAEMILLGMLTGNGPGFYLMAGLYRADIPWRDKCGHLNSFKYRLAVDDLNPPRLRAISQHKLAEKCVFRSIGLPTPDLIGLLHPTTGVSTDGSPLCTKSQFAMVARRHAGKTLCFKLVRGWAGRGFVAAETRLEDDQPRFRLKGGTAEDRPDLDLDAFWNMITRGDGRDGRLVEEYFFQHEDMASFNPSSLNTCRVWVIRRGDQPAEVALAYLRMGRTGSAVDNQSAGGIVAPIDLSSGCLAAAIDGLFTRQKFAQHPDHGAQIEGVAIPFWQDVKLLAERALTVFPGLRFAGADIAIGPQGAVVIEMNASPDREGAAFVGIPTDRIFRR